MRSGAIIGSEEERSEVFPGERKKSVQTGYLAEHLAVSANIQTYEHRTWQKTPAETYDEHRAD
jgi:hypothetical protein